MQQERCLSRTSRKKSHRWPRSASVSAGGGSRKWWSALDLDLHHGARQPYAPVGLVNTRERIVPGALGVPAAHEPRLDSRAGGNGVQQQHADRRLLTEPGLLQEAKSRTACSCSPMLCWRHAGANWTALAPHPSVGGWRPSSTSCSWVMQHSVQPAEAYKDGSCQLAGPCVAPAPSMAGPGLEPRHFLFHLHLVWLAIHFSAELRPQMVPPASRRLCRVSMLPAKLGADLSLLPIAASPHRPNPAPTLLLLPHYAAPAVIQHWRPPPKKSVMLSPVSNPAWHEASLHCACAGDVPPTHPTANDGRCSNRLGEAMGGARALANPTPLPTQAQLRGCMAPPGGVH